MDHTKHRIKICIQLHYSAVSTKWNQALQIAREDRMGLPSPTSFLITFFGRIGAEAYFWWIFEGSGHIKWRKEFPASCSIYLTDPDGFVAGYIFLYFRFSLTAPFAADQGWSSTKPDTFASDCRYFLNKCSHISLWRGIPRVKYIYVMKVSSCIKQSKSELYLNNYVDFILTSPCMRWVKKDYIFFPFLFWCD